MSFVPTRYTSPPLLSELLKSLPDSAPSTNDLEILQDELKALQQRTLERARKAGNDIRLIEQSMRRIKEREKGKQKVTDRIKKERDHTPMLDPPSFSPPPSGPRSRLGSNASHGAASFSQRPSVDSTRSFETHKKKKRKRDEDDSDGERETHRIRKASPAPSTHSLSNSYSHPSKAQKIPAPVVLSKAPTTQEWNVPPPTALALPPRPPIPSPPPPGPAHPTEVMDDFSKWKQPSQIQVTTFYSSIEPWLRPIKEEDVGFLSYAGDEVTPFVIPPLGQHYSEVWEAEDIALYGHPLPNMPYGSAPHRARAPPRWEPSTLAETDLLDEQHAQGPLTERLVSALLPSPDTTVWKGVKAAEEAMEGRPSGGAGAAAARDSMTVADLEDRVRASVRAIGVLDDQTEPETLEAVDDPISTALRQAQRELRTVLATNKLRRQRLSEIARDRLGYQEYLELRDSLDRNISSMYTRLQKRDTPKPPKESAHKKKKKGDGSNGVHALDPGPPPPAPAALGLHTDAEHHVRPPEQLEKLVQTRRQWVDTIGAVFEQKQKEHPGRLWGFPPTSAFEGIDEEVRAMLADGSLGGKPAEPVGSNQPKASAPVNAAAASRLASQPNKPISRGWSMEGVESTEHG